MNARLAFRFALTRRLARQVRRYRASRNGAAAVEFALVATPFLGILFAIIETGLVFFAGQVLDTATLQSSRFIFTGQATGASEAAFRSDLCSRATSMFTCGNIGIDVRSYTTFSQADTSPPVSGGVFNPATMTFNSTQPGAIVVVKVAYEWPLVVPSLGFMMGDLTNGNRLMLSTIAFRNEPS